LAPGTVLLGWALLVNAPQEAATQGMAVQIAQVVAAEQSDRIAAIQDTLKVASLSQRLVNADHAACDAYLAEIVAGNGLINNLVKIEPDGEI
ncbi:hypothetical protein, partial [Klebsiella pneumoniae]|uniref:hypothetical protein n=1 Tax=Klebsiella pneumoniae TaxID=573 RepID=UPI0030135321